MSKKSKVLIASGSRHTIPPVQNSPGVPRIIYQLTEFSPADFDFYVISKFSKLLDHHEYDHGKYLHCKPKFSDKFVEYVLKFSPYRWRKKKYGFTQPDRITYYHSVVSNAKKIKPDLVITFMHFELFKMLKNALPDAKHVFFFRSTDLLGRIGKTNLDFLINNSNGFLANTKSPIEEIRSLYPSISFPMTTIYNAVAKVELTAANKENIRKQFRSKFGLEENHFVMGYAGRFSEEKSLLEILRVLKELRQEGIVIHFIVAGDIKNEKTPNFDYFEKIIDFTNTYIPDQVHFTGWIPNKNLCDFYCSLDAGIILSKYREGNSMFLIEAMSYGVPMVATSIGGNSEIIINNETGFLIGLKDLEYELKERLLELKNNPELQKLFSMNAKRYVQFNHANDNMTNLFSDFVKTICDNHF